MILRDGMGTEGKFFLFQSKPSLSWWDSSGKLNQLLVVPRLSVPSSGLGRKEVSLARLKEKEVS
jgi:hypothetical protein